jgi:hypothetical protein
VPCAEPKRVFVVVVLAAIQLVKHVKKILYCKAFGLSNSGAAMSVYNVVLEK